jgi:ADP-ribose pyrophosphatase YjhB (NUDIX family)
VDLVHPPSRARVLLLSPRQRLLLFKYRNTQLSGQERPLWTTPGGACEAGEALGETALREVSEETGMSGITLGPVVWYGEDRHRSGDRKIVFKEHFIVAHAPTETLDTSNWTDHERNQILTWRWWSLDDLRESNELIYPFDLARLLEPILAGDYPSDVITLPRI